MRPSPSNVALAGSQQLTQFAKGNAKDNIGDLLKTLQDISATSKPTEIAEIYAGFMRDSAKKQADHLVAIGEILALNREARGSPSPRQSHLQLKARRIDAKIIRLMGEPTRPEIIIPSAAI
jgi:hypothetical protein